MNNPVVTCLQLSYGRPQLSVEAVESFLRQTYANKKLIIINTHPSPVYFNKEYDNIEVHNIKPLGYLSDVYRFGLDLISSEYFCIWDDDDLFMPWHIEDRMRFSLENPEYDAIGHSHCLTSMHNKLEGIGQNMFVAQYLYKNNGIRPDANVSCWDVGWHYRPWKRGEFSFPARPSYIYRWGTGESHISGWGGQEEAQHKGYLLNIQEKHKVRFDFPWIPRWDKEYDKEVIELLNKKT
jgi:hypothetical protein